MSSYLRELTPEDEERIINRLSDEVMKRELQAIAIMLLESNKPIFYIGSEMLMFFVAPVLWIFGDFGIDYIKFFNKQENAERLLKRIEEEIKIQDEEKRKTKEQAKLIMEKFHLNLDLPSGFTLQEEPTLDSLSSSIIGIKRKDSAGGGYVAISLTTTDISPNEIFSEIATSLDNENVRRALMLTQDITLSKLESKQNYRKIKGHQASMTTYEWSDRQDQRGIIESYGMWCDKTRRLFVVSVRTGPLTGQKNEKNQTKNLRLVLGSITCH